jgi:hypothetical protein
MLEDMAAASEDSSLAADEASDNTSVVVSASRCSDRQADSGASPARSRRGKTTSTGAAILDMTAQRVAVEKEHLGLTREQFESRTALDDRKMTLEEEDRKHRRALEEEERRHKMALEAKLQEFAEKARSP